MLLRGDTEFTQTKHLDRWDDAGDVRFIFGIDAHETLKAIADGLPAEAYYASWSGRRSTRSRRCPVSSPSGSRPRSSSERGLRDDPHAGGDGRRVRRIARSPAGGSYRVVVVRKRLGVDKGQMRLFEEYRYFFYITNDREMTAEEVVFSANDRCDQENLIAQLKGGVHALTTPVDDLVSNWAYMVMASLAWSLKAWSALLAAGVAPARGEAPGGEANAVADGVPDVLRGDDPDALPDRQDGRPADLPAAVVEPVARGLPAAGRAAAGLLAVLRRDGPEVGVRMPRSAWAIEPREGTGDGAESSRGGRRGSGPSG